MSRAHEDDVPDAWELTTISRIATVNPPGSTVAADDDQLVTFIPMTAVEELSGRVDMTRERPFGEVKKGFTRFRDGDLLFAKITPCMENGKTAVVRGLRQGIGCGSTEFHVVRPVEGVNPDYLRLFISRSAFRQEAKRNMQGAVGQQRVPVDFLRETPIPLPPPAEQQRIVSKIDELFSRIDEGERPLERVQTLVERYRQAVLKTAMTGELTREWRRRNLLPSWQKRPLRLLGTITTGTTPPTADPDNYTDVGTPFLKPTDLDQGYNVVSGRQWLTSKGVRHGRQLKANSVLVTCIGATIGKVGLARMPCATNQQINAVEVNDEDLLAKFLYWFFASPQGQNAVIGGSSATTLPILNKSRFEALEVPVPSIDEQSELVKRIEERFSQADEASKSIDSEKRRLRVLRQAVLREAFSGKLVAQNLNDEPAAVLLERIAGAKVSAARVAAKPKRNAVAS